MMACFSLAPMYEKHVGTFRFLYISFIVTFFSGIMYVGISLTIALLSNDWTWLLSSSIGYSGTLFAYATLETFLPNQALTRNLFGMIEIPSKMYPWILLLVLQLLVPNVSFFGHLTGILCGVMHAKGLFYCLLPPIEWILSSEGNGGMLRWVSDVPGYVKCTEHDDDGVGNVFMCCRNGDGSGGDGGDRDSGVESKSNGRESASGGYDWGSGGRILGGGGLDVVDVKVEDDGDEDDEDDGDDEARLLGV